MLQLVALELGRTGGARVEPCPVPMRQRLWTGYRRETREKEMARWQRQRAT